MNHLTPTGAAELPKCTAADGSTEVINVPGYPLMVRAVDFNRLRAKVEELSAAQAELAAMRAGGEPVAEMVPYHTPSGKRVAVISRFQHLPIGTKLYTHPQPAAQDADDAKRYRVIRSNQAYTVKCGGETLHCGGHTNLNKEKFAQGLDAAIDAAIAAQQGDCHE